MIKVFKKRDLFALKAEIKGYAAEAASVRAQIHKSEGAERYNLWTKKRTIGNHARHALLAYAFLRNVPYSVIEKKMSKVSFHSPYLYNNGAVELNLNQIRNICLKFVYTYQHDKLTVEQIAAWIQNDTPAFQKPVVKTATETGSAATL